ncbi:unnamed protein product [Moneuplotes crassus]|uniref:Uncharacterized protein n=1 Tax=Euplotes crassus TaxID=5936 RepID=A0AAD1X5V4_EUPCR|nr:unnamed protein product [Moneuplotes crassus]
MGKVMFKGQASYNGRQDEVEEIEINVSKPVSKNFALLRFWSLKDLRKVINRHSKYPVLLNKFQFRDLMSSRHGSVFGLDKNNSDYTFKQLASFTPHKMDPKLLNSVIHNSIMSSLNKDKEVVDGMKPKAINKICFYELMSAMIIMSHANYYNKVRFLY